MQVQELADKVSDDLNEKVEELSKLFVRYEEADAIINKLKILGKNVE